MSVWAVVVAAGTGVRFGGEKPKPLADLAGKPVIVRTLDVFEQCPVVAGIVLVVHQDWLKDYKDIVAAHHLKKVRAVAVGGATRAMSVRSGLRAVGADADVIMVHDGVRPLVTADIITAGVSAVQATGAAVAAVPVKPTIKVVDPLTHRVVETLDRSRLWEIQTPQVFRRSVIEAAYAAGGDEATDDAALVEQNGAEVRVFTGSCANIKITTPEDLVMARALLK